MEKIQCILDTYSWTKLLKLEESGWSKLIENILINNSILLTHEVKRDLLHWYPTKENMFDRTTVYLKLHKFVQLVMVKRKTFSFSL